VKDRVALRSKIMAMNDLFTATEDVWNLVIDDAERQGLLYPHTGSRIFEGTVGSTGISIATIAKAR
jgi:cysteine synthase